MCGYDGNPGKSRQKEKEKWRPFKKCPEWDTE
jgi:hypothetical protein